MGRFGTTEIVSAQDVPSWWAIRGWLKISPDKKIDAIVVIPPWIDGKHANVHGLNDKEAPDADATDAD